MAFGISGDSLAEIHDISSAVDSRGCIDLGKEGANIPAELLDIQQEKVDLILAEIEHHPDAPAPHLKLGKLLEQLGLLPAAKNAYSDAIVKSILCSDCDTEEQARFTLCNLHFKIAASKSDRTAQKNGFDLVEHSARKFPGSALTQALFALQALSSGDWPTAELHAERACAIDPNIGADTYSLIGDYQSLALKHGLAYLSYKQAISICDELEDPFQRLTALQQKAGTIALRLHDFDAAREHFLTSIHYGNSSTEVYNRYLCACFKSGSKAREEVLPDLGGQDLSASELPIWSLPQTAQELCYAAMLGEEAITFKGLPDDIAEIRFESLIEGRQTEAKIAINHQGDIEVLLKDMKSKTEVLFVVDSCQNGCDQAFAAAWNAVDPIKKGNLKEAINRLFELLPDGVFRVIRSPFVAEVKEAFQEVLKLPDWDICIAKTPPERALKGEILFESSAVLVKNDAQGGGPKYSEFLLKRESNGALFITVTSPDGVSHTSSVVNLTDACSFFSDTAFDDSAE